MVPLESGILAHILTSRLWSLISNASRAIRTFSFKRASLMGLLGRTAAAVMGAFVLESDIVNVVLGLLGEAERIVNR